MKHRHTSSLASIMPLNGLYNKKGKDLAGKTPKQELDDYIDDLFDRGRLEWSSLYEDEKGKLATLTHLISNHSQQCEVFTDAFNAASIAALAGEYSLHEDSSTEKNKSKLGRSLLSLIQETIEEYWASDAEEYFSRCAEIYRDKWADSEKIEAAMSRSSAIERTEIMLAKLCQKGAA